MLNQLKIAIVCDWLTVYAGAERVLHEMHQLFPNAPIYTTLYKPGTCSLFKNADVRESGLKFIPGARRFHRLFLPFMPGVFERIDLSEYDLVISSSHSAAKGVITKPETLHVSYCHSPMRYVWDHSHEYQSEFKSFKYLKWFYRPILHRIRLWDRVAADRVDHYLANSKYIGQRIKKYYDRDSDVLYPPVDLSLFKVKKDPGSYFLAVGRLIPYKRFDLAVEACKKMKLPLKVVGVGPELNRLKKMAGTDTEFMGKVSDEELRSLYQGAKALIFPQREDFGIVPLEAMACGTPVLAFGHGGALETVKDGVSGLFFYEQTQDSLLAAIKKFEKCKWDAKLVAETVEGFSTARFRSELLHELEKIWKEHNVVVS